MRNNYFYSLVLDQFSKDSTSLPFGAKFNQLSRILSGNKHTVHLFFISGVFWMMFSFFALLLFQSLFSVQSPEKSLAMIEQPASSDFGSVDSVFNNKPFESIQKMRERMMKGFGGLEALEENFFKPNGAQIDLFGNSQKSYVIANRETKDSLIYEIKLENNVEGESVNVAVENGMVTISGQKKMTHKDDRNGGQYHFSSSSSFSQSFSVPHYVDSENVKIMNEGKKIILTFPKQGQEV